jgi:hypothetical protein
MVQGEAASSKGDSPVHVTVVHDGQSQCMRGTYVKISQEYITWDVFKKFVGKVVILLLHHV